MTASPSAPGGPPPRDRLRRAALLRRVTPGAGLGAASGADGLVVDWTGACPGPPGDAGAPLQQALPDPLTLWLRCSAEEPDHDGLEAAAALGYAGVVLAECRGGPHLQQWSVALAVAEAMAGRVHGDMAIVAEMGCAGLLALPSLLGATARLAALTWNPRRLAHEARAAFRPWLVTAASAAGVPAFDQTTSESDPAEALAIARGFGFTGVIVQAPPLRPEEPSRHGGFEA